MELHQIPPVAPRIHLPAHHLAGERGGDRRVQKDGRRTAGFQFGKKHAEQQEGDKAARPSHRIKAVSVEKRQWGRD
ncbi:hypothetical protein N5C66_28315 [Rhizobium pusense]|uniref:hypothetical protein n=1 Tax=Rhizobium sp. P007 TaxID=285908 RepID=UPI001F3B9B5A|nr:MULTISPECIES: hypothetical protein [Rhizobium/Agrobacterium group]MDH0908189.1 hypothetical protein [Agrobacterium pusense]MDH1094020.1 hypothetical protein [Agrobacterium pusense]MDH1115598.1 hypothetical protein [Agrobacterium pusense]MDH2192394.1 hypothetical protein [Agrobacterium pusense]